MEFDLLKITTTCGHRVRKSLLLLEYRTPSTEKNAHVLESSLTFDTAHAG